MNFKIEDESMSRRQICFISKQKPHEISVWSLPNRSQEQRYNRESLKITVLDPACRGKSDIPALCIPKPFVSHADSGVLH